jgi:hypothetical protein
MNLVSSSESNPLGEGDLNKNPLVLQIRGCSVVLVAHQHKILITCNFQRNNQTDSDRTTTDMHKAMILVYLNSYTLPLDM